MQDNRFDVVVVGGGMVGAALACGLALQQFRVAVVERAEPAPFDPDSDPDVRISAIGSASVGLLKQLDVWPRVQAMRCAPYRKLETWEWQTAHVSFDAASLGLPELGFMVENNVLQRALWERMEQLDIQLRCPATLSSLQQENGGWRLDLSDGEALHTRLVVGADGANSQVRQMAGIGIQGWSYAQSCLLISVTCEHPTGDSTWQQFTPQGPRAFLPLYDNRASLVWYDAPARIRQLQAMPMPQLEKEIAATFPARLGRFKAHAAGGFPLVRRHAQRYVLPGLALIGDAAHTINPLAGQGVNLGYRDVDALVEVLVEARSNAQEWASENVLRRYQSQRRRDNLLMQGGMDLFYFAFSNRLPPLTFARNLGLIAAERSGALKRKVLRYALGL
ncbi:MULTISPECIES: 3-demethoxyubiquinol 3-hydroxylase [Pantoea]|jgi:2-octaprenyl-3-methyl-6-methoxy-1,4-benzoquinol hydroxylase|uniref:3-demethoxyubiquinol 3-hydroxylase n=1 Tax=Pantoea TaxID=53335 RepID=UPI000EA1DF4E|nr:MULTISPECIES: 3-demethoxyubiquinol 3-hydroxylase [Pantoea]MBZ6385825.1 2-octaprenyl-3-methyl-6-methoxy-1,4-benzoquinol hydroxylase [Pantoea piersonii]MBZ6400911.1 2-octaprenyl-3-methyl-6-methoxy-1,4-benzoquinol hydroxylase [Pantoea piersonii]MBZ6409531.1 2-octaprenyl-3-methyl-6-methoxy-1,4-benzoquinol hydroxylase [Pantoea piersonii]MBZ6428838.1 2-octaprenyl-3-methyl-6-methoxy-1,4-benzoquinol hydroxylase [Pantoea piersonii]NYB02521.1 2-octaprenyl-3-methyl-6-methoxy-1,4-benzoquinol hydroxylas